MRKDPGRFGEVARASGLVLLLIGLLPVALLLLIAARTVLLAGGMAVGALALVAFLFGDPLRGRSDRTLLHAGGVS